MKKRAVTEHNPNPPAQVLFQRLERLESELEGNGHTGHNRWMVPYADLLTLLLGLFLVILTAGQAETSELKAGVPASEKQKPGQEQVKDSEKLPNTSLKESNESVKDMALASQLEERLNVTGIEVRPQERGLVISLKDSILFAPGSAELSTDARRTLDHLARELKATPGTGARPIRVEGYTDNTPIQTSQFPSNWELSTARATNIVRYLVTGHHFSPDKLSAAGYGEFKPMADNSTIGGKQKNRRVDIVVLNSHTANQEPPALQGPATEEEATQKD